MSYDISVLVITAASIGFFHTLFGPDHYLPFIVMSKSGNWSLGKTAVITFLCGIGHVLSSVVLGIIGVVFGIAATRLEVLESFRGNIAAWILIAFGLIYFIWGVCQAIRSKPHNHLHSHDDTIDHEHPHAHNNEHLHAHIAKEQKNITPWVLFTIFVLGPCEPLIPLLMYPAAKNSFWGLIAVTSVFGVITIVTMMSIVFISTYGISFVSVSKLERYVHAMAGGIVFLSGISIQFLGL